MRVVQYSGKENGLMLIGSATELRELGQALLKFTANAPERSPETWPPFAADVEIALHGEYSVSFHLDTTAGDNPKTNFPYRRWLWSK